MSAPAHVPDRGAGTSSWPRLPASFVAVAAMLVVAAATAGWLGRTLTGPEPAAPVTPRAVDLGPVALTAPGAWAPARGPIAGLPELDTQVVAFSPAPGLSARAALTLAPFDDPTLVPAALRPLIGAGAPRRAALAGLPAWTYTPREVARGRMAQITVAPTSGGSVTAICIAPSAMWSAAAGCADGFAAASLEGATPLVPGPSLAFRRELAPVLDRLNGRRAELRRSLRGAATRRAQARFAIRLARAHVRAMAAITPAATATGAPRRVVTELRRTARSYGRLAVAARNRWPRRYRQARVAIRRSDRALAAAVAAVR